MNFIHGLNKPKRRRCEVAPPPLRLRKAAKEPAAAANQNANFNIAGAYPTPTPAFAYPAQQPQTPAVQRQPAVAYNPTVNYGFR
ncbi:unnamed protein product [Phyllotreta striolata]|uniref:Uncharacterized protein n=1 Tax=Phyllotreta striolata TaxID=444603 RepID=A0A9N9TY15_PHYSR|nr:unnamed protein product [Phyllotreta striolata]